MSSNDNLNEERVIENVINLIRNYDTRGSSFILTYQVEGRETVTADLSNKKVKGALWPPNYGSPQFELIMKVNRRDQ